jgi:L-lysine cyclodeaminase
MTALTIPLESHARRQTLMVTESDLARLVAHVGIDRLMADAIDALEAAFRGFDRTRTEVRKRDGFTLSGERVGCLEWMPVLRHGDSATLKLVSYCPANPARFNLPTIIATNYVFDATTGHLAALLDGVFATALRTGAASAVASRYLARRSSASTCNRRRFSASRASPTSSAPSPPSASARGRSSAPKA